MQRVCLCVLVCISGQLSGCCMREGGFRHMGEWVKGFEGPLCDGLLFFHKEMLDVFLGS